MNIIYSREDKLLMIELTEEIDQHTADKVRRKIDDEIERFIPRKVVFDFSNISFMDSSGIGMVLGRYKLIKMLGGELELINVHKTTKKIFDMSGVSRIIKIAEQEEKYKIKQQKENIHNQILNNLDKEEKSEGII
ncbi:MAG: anti-sigma factor antagonist [Clostridia bacterium]|nr:anti-sigma factor antagonist [Clostridia bacterium]MBR3324614.1 anti-sigma factor antagonist [Clostridia bacterium]